MSLKCLLGLVSCLNYMGDKIPDEAVYSIIYQCDRVTVQPTLSFVIDGKYRAGQQQGYIILEQLEKSGLKFSWKPDKKVSNYDRASQNYNLATYRKREVERACSKFLSVANNKTNWPG